MDLRQIRYFVSVAERGGFAAAASTLNIAQSALSRHVKELEDELGGALLERGARGVSVTESGKVLLARGRWLLGTIDDIKAEVRTENREPSGTVRIGAPDGFGSHFLASRLVKFTERYPDLDLQLVATARLFSLSKREADIAISLTMPKEGRIVGRKLLDYTLGLYAAPAYLAQAPVIAARADLPRHRFVGYIEELLFTPELDYLPQVSPKISAKFRSANLIAQLNATIAGFGIAVLPHFMASAHPELQPVLPDEVRISRTFWLLMHADSKDLARIRAVADYIYETVEAERALFSGV